MLLRSKHYWDLKVVEICRLLLFLTKSMLQEWTNFSFEKTRKTKPTIRFNLRNLYKYRIKIYFCNFSNNKFPLEQISSADFKSISHSILKSFITVSTSIVSQSFSINWFIGELKLTIPKRDKTNLFQ